MHEKPMMDKTAKELLLDGQAMRTLGARLGESHFSFMLSVEPKRELFEISPWPVVLPENREEFIAEYSDAFAQLGKTINAVKSAKTAMKISEQRVSSLILALDGLFEYYGRASSDSLQDFTMAKSLVGYLHSELYESGKFLSLFNGVQGGKAIQKEEFEKLFLDESGRYQRVRFTIQVDKMLRKQGFRGIQSNKLKRLFAAASDIFWLHKSFGEKEAAELQKEMRA